MKKFFVVFFMAAFFMAAHGQNAQNPNLSTSYYKSNMHCAACEKTLFEYLRFATRFLKRFFEKYWRFK